MASAPCRNPVAQQSTHQTLNLMNEAIVPVRDRNVSIAEAETAVVVARHALVAATLNELVEMGLVETFVDEHLITRYRPTNGRVA
jgi:hypothetical protein